MNIIKTRRTQGFPPQWIGTIALIVFFPQDSFAWAPATHLFFAKEVLHFSSLLPAAIQALLKGYPADYLYGCIAADITIGKALVEYIYNCHNFDVGFDLLKRAQNDSERAFVYGYLSHLAADTVSHNYFVPYQNIEHLSSNRFRHAYWEVRLDSYFGDRVWGDVERATKNPRNHDHDRLLDNALKDTIFSFRTNKVLFSSMLAIQRLKKWQQLVKVHDNTSRMQFNPHHLAEYNRLAVAAIILLLTTEENSPVYRVDPTGCKTVEEAVTVRRLLRQARRSGGLSKRLHEEECHRFRATVRKHFFEEYVIESAKFRPSIHMVL